MCINPGVAGIWSWRENEVIFVYTKMFTSKISIYRNFSCLSLNLEKIAQSSVSCQSSASVKLVSGNDWKNFSAMARESVFLDGFDTNDTKLGRKKREKKQIPRNPTVGFFGGVGDQELPFEKQVTILSIQTPYSSLGKSLRHVSNICIVWSLYGKSNSVNLKRIEEKRQFTHVEPSLASDLFFSSPAWAGFESGMDGQCFSWHKQIIQQYNLNRSQFVIQKHMGVSKNRGGPPGPQNGWWK